jgi:hypothetical protein
MKAIACGRRGAGGKNRETRGTFRPHLPSNQFFHILLTIKFQAESLRLMSPNLFLCLPRAPSPPATLERHAKRARS